MLVRYSVIVIAEKGIWESYTMNIATTFDDILIEAR